ncbi:MAG: T9SS type A sorting domain-containing protein [Prevotella sp.]|nr:T9SS type A sorting domain-containing protein [Prevotella sp.]
MKNFTRKVALLAAFLFLSVCGIQAQVTPESQMEKLDRGVVAVKVSSGGKYKGNFISWRLLGTDDPDVVFNVLRDGERIAENIGNVTCYDDEDVVDEMHQYQVETVVNGEVIETSDALTIDDDILKFKIDYHKGGDSYKYIPNDIAVADLDGDGEYELIVKWDPTNSKDNSQSGKTARVLVEAYKISTGKCMWKINMGYAIRAGAHYTQILAYDFDGDGKAEVIMKTAPNSADSKGNYVSEVGDDEIKNNTDNSNDTAQNTYRNSNGYVLGGPEFLTVFNGETGEAINTVYYNPNRGFGVGGSASYSSSWGDSYGGRGDRFLACVAYLDGPDKNPSAVLCRGYYTRAYLWAVDFDGEKLSTKWLHASTSTSEVTVTDANGKSTTTKYSSNKGNTGYSYTAYGNGNHNLSVADVDGDGCDEIIYGSCAINNDGNLLYAVGYGHGDAMHLSDLCPDRPGLEVFQVHEEKHPSYGFDIHDAATGEVILFEKGSGDNGRGMAADVDSLSRGFEFWSSNDRNVRSCVDGSVLSTKSQSQCFRLYWDGDAYDELFDGSYDSSTDDCQPAITKYNGSSVTTLLANGWALRHYKAQTCNTTKATPNLIADIFGDWREEIITWCIDSETDSCTLLISTSTYPTSYRVPTLMHDHTYRMGVAWQNVAYNQPAHLGYYLPDYIESYAAATGIKNIYSVNGGWIRMFDENSLEINSDGSHATKIGIYDISGREQWSESLTINGTQTVELPQMPKGVYIIKATSGTDTFNKKFLAE